MTNKILFLGTGSSAGIPAISCNCLVCRSDDKKNKRLRPSCLIKIKNKTFLLDVSPDFRQQALINDINHIDGIILTHSHYDHAGGLPEIRQYNFLEKKAIPCLLSNESLKELQKIFYYIFESPNANKSLGPLLEFQKLKDDNGTCSFNDIKIKYFSFFQKETKVTGYRIGSLAYVSDIKKYQEDIFDYLKDLDILVLSAPRTNPSPMHFSINDAIFFSQKVGAKKTYFTHIAHETDHKTINESLPENIFLAYDGLELEFNL